MATLSAHKGVEQIYRDKRDFRYAICKDGKVLSRGTMPGSWSLTGFTADGILALAASGKLRTDPADAKIIAAANVASHSREGAKQSRRARRRSL